MDLIQTFTSNLQLQVSNCKHTGNIQIHFGEVPYDQLDEIKKQIRIALIAHVPYGQATVLTTLGNNYVLLSVLYYPMDGEQEPLEITFK